VLKVANAALRFRPPGNDEKSALAGRETSGAGSNSGMGRGRGGGAGKLWVLGNDGQPSSIEVKTGINDGNQTELIESELAQDREVIVGMTSGAQKKPISPPRMF
jgi:hypothetical protein